MQSADIDDIELQQFVSQASGQDIKLRGVGTLLAQEQIKMTGHQLHPQTEIAESYTADSGAPLLLLRYPHSSTTQGTGREPPYR